MNKRAFLYKIIEEGNGQRTYEVWNNTGQTYQIPEARIDPSCLPLVDGACGVIEQSDDGKWFWIQTD